MSRTPRDDPSDPEAASGSESSSERRRGGRRRTYNRRMDDHDVAPPYFETFDRIATALEHIEAILRSGHVRLPDAGAAPTFERH